MTSHIELDRRTFLRGAGMLVATAGLPAVSWGRCLGANERLQLAVIGVGGMGGHHTRSLMGRREVENLDVIRVCDVYQRRLDQAVETIQKKPGSGTMEYREVLDDPDVDAVVIATPDHWHTKIAIEAMQAGKDVYVEKPLSLTIEQAIDCRNAVARTGRILQVGPQGTSDDRFWRARDAIAADRIGKVTWSQGSYCRNSRGGQFNWHIDPDAGPDQSGAGYVWWDRWLGHEWGLAEQIPWNADHFFRFRKYWAYNGGVATDLLYHKLAPMLLAITGPEGEYPLKVSAGGGLQIEDDGRDIPDNFMLMVDYPSRHTVVLISVMTNDVGIPDVIHGQYGTMEFEDGLVLREQKVWAPEFRRINDGLFMHRTITDDQGDPQPDPPHGEASFSIDTQPRPDHMQNFLQSVRGEATPHCNVKLGCSTMVAIKMGVEAYRTGRSLRWDADAEQVV